MSEFQKKIFVNTSFNDDEIVQTITGEYPNEIARYIVRLQDQGIRDALIKLGWTPPPHDRREE